ncbi:hypothetical protein NDN08_002771 [Rhodosorus marinus]|uniref:Cleavage/polyadenylation specificity factor A subunit N-terminal domain-containing protein n=1 Tax=Rhodosorus marinus TaxID=101924 RepID=A0AAV8UYQ4_9RHOD|nr:hypothetical protein NDN08_002771 [Rhodosorus marinus]
MANTILFGLVLVVALYVSAAQQANVVVVTGDNQNIIQLNHAHTMDIVQTIQHSEKKLFQVLSLATNVYVSAVSTPSNYPQAEILMYEVQSGTNTLKFVQKATFAPDCGQPVALTASYDYTDQAVLAMTCSDTEWVVVMDAWTLSVDQIVGKPRIKDITITGITESALTAKYLYVTYGISAVDNDDKGLLVQYSRTTPYEILNTLVVRGQYSHLLIAGGSNLFLTTSGNGPSYLLQLNPNTLEEIDRRSPKNLDFLRMTMSPDQLSMYMYVQNPNGRRGKIRSFDQRSYPAQKYCPDVEIDLPPGTQSIVVEGYLFIRTAGTVTRLNLVDETGCPSPDVQGNIILNDDVVYSGVAMACLECLPIA